MPDESCLLQCEGNVFETQFGDDLSKFQFPAWVRNICKPWLTPAMLRPILRGACTKQYVELGASYQAPTRRSLLKPMNLRRRFRIHFGNPFSSYMSSSVGMPSANPRRRILSSIFYPGPHPFEFAARLFLLRAA